MPLKIPTRPDSAFAKELANNPELAKRFYGNIDLLRQGMSKQIRDAQRSTQGRPGDSEIRIGSSMDD